ncbi:MAG TPA: cytidylate kinase-like family protein [Firmicutes bacterium]|nr:cytidylate kinase-like family protein [Bacillota bacterium]
MSKLLITISREYGSGGLLVGQELAEALGLPCYDKKLLTIAAEKSGFSEEMLRQAESRATNSLLYSLATSLGVGAFGPDTLSLYDKLYLAQFDVIRQMADEGSCVIVGRCADYVLRAYENCYHFFLHAPLEDRMERATKEYGENPNNIKSTVLKHDKARANYYYHYTSQKWGDAKLYDLSLNTSRTGVDGAVKMLLHYLETIHAV